MDLPKKNHPHSHPGNAQKQWKYKPLHVPARSSKKLPREILQLTINLPKPLGKSMILHLWPATIQEHPKRTWAPEVDAHEGRAQRKTIGIPWVSCRRHMASLEHVQDAGSSATKILQ